MSKATELVVQLHDTLNEIESEYNRMRNLVSQYDQELSKAYHEIEVRDRVNVVQGFDIYRELKKILRKRRIVKNELHYYESIITAIDIFRVKGAANRAKKNINKLKQKHLEYTSDWGLNFEDVAKEKEEYDGGS